MANREIQVARDRVVLGALPENDARQLLEIGFFKPTDIFWADDVAEWKFLGDLDSDEPKEQKKWLDRAKRSASATAHAVVSSALVVTGKLKRFAFARKVGASEAAAKALEGYMPQIKKTLLRLADTKPVQAIQSGVRDENLMRKVFGAAYDCLPKPVCRFVSEQRFIDFCMQHKQRLLDPRSVRDVPME
jgi:hypothetical protein